MKAISKQGPQLCGNRFAAAPLRQTLKNMGAKDFPGNDSGFGSGFSGGLSLQKKSARVTKRFRIAKHSSMAKKRELESANDAIVEQLQESLASSGVILPAQQDALDENTLYVKNPLLSKDGFASIVSIEHPLITAYIASCQQGNRVIYVSPQRANLGFAPEAWLGKTDFRLQQVHEGDSERLSQALQHTCSTGEKFNCHYRLYDSNGKIRWFHDEASVVRDESGMPLFIRGVMLDITDKKEMEIELNGHRHHLERYVDLRTERLMRRIALLESCNASLGDKLALTQRELAALKQQLVASAMRQDPAAQIIPATQAIQDAQTNDCEEPLDGISDWARNMIGWRVAAAGAIT